MTLKIRRLIWDEENPGHIARHKVTPQEVKEVCDGPYVVQPARLGRFALIGPTLAGRLLVVILEPQSQPSVYRPITAFRAKGRYRRAYLARAEGDES
jgi:hypothetical protein